MTVLIMLVIPTTQNKESQNINQKLIVAIPTRLPVEVVFVELFETRQAAFEAERKIKKWTRKKKEALIKRDFDKIKLSAKKKF